MKVRFFEYVRPGIRAYLFKAVRLFFLPNFPGPTFIPCPTSIPEARVLSNKGGIFLKVDK